MAAAEVLELKGGARRKRAPRRVVAGGRPPSGAELWEEAVEFAALYLRIHVRRLPSDDPQRTEIEQFAACRGAYCGGGA